MARVLVAHNYFLGLDPHEAALGKPYPPLTPVVAATRARARGHEVRFWDSTFASGPDAFAAALDAAGPHLDGVAILADDLSVQQKMCLRSMREAGLAMVRLARSRNLRVLVGGPDASEHPEAWSEASAVLVGDPTEALCEWASGEAAVAGLHGAGGAGGRRAVMDDLDRLPAPDWGLLDLEPYARTWRAKHGAWELNLSTARGCPYRCNWCAKPTWGRTYHVRAPPAVAAEIAHVRARWKPDRLWMTDDIFAIKPAWLREFRDAIASLAADVRDVPGPWPVPFRCLSRADLLVDAAFAADLAASGCREAWMGAESGSDRILRAMDKDQTTAEIARAAENLRRHGIRAGFFLQLGYPGETLDDVRATVRMVRELRPDEIGVSVSYPHAGTAFHERVAASMKEEMWEASMDNVPLHGAPYRPAFYAAAKEVLRSEHSASMLGEAVRALVSRPGSDTARRLAGSAFHRARRPFAHAAMRLLARPNPGAVALTW